MFPVRLVFLIDVLITAISFVLSYYLCSLILPNILSHGMLVQLPIIVALTSLIFLFIGIYKGYVKYDKVREVYNIFNAICITNILTIVLVVVNGKLVMEEDLMVPLSIIIVHSIISFSALVVSRYLYKSITHFKRFGSKTIRKAVLFYDGNIAPNVLNSALAVLEKKNEGVSFTACVWSPEMMDETYEVVESFYLQKSFLDADSLANEKMIKQLYGFNKPIYSINFFSDGIQYEQWDVLNKHKYHGQGDNNNDLSKKDKGLFKGSISNDNDTIIKQQTA